MDTRWSRSASNFYALIGQNLTGEFMRKIYAASLTACAEAYRVFCQLVMFLTVFFHWDEPTKRVPFTAEPEIPEILTKWKAPKGKQNACREKFTVEFLSNSRANHFNH